MTNKPLISNPDTTIIAFYNNKEIHRTEKPEYQYFFKYGFIDHKYTLND